MTLEQDADRFPAHPPCQLPLHRFLGEEPHTPPRPAFRRRAAHQGDDALTLARVQHPPLARTRLLVPCRLQPFLLVAPGNGPHRLGGYTHIAGYLPGRLPLAEFPQDHSPPQHPRRFPPLVQHGGDLFTILLGQLDMHPMIGSHACTMPLFCSFHEYL